MTQALNASQARKVEQATVVVRVQEMTGRKALELCSVYVSYANFPSLEQMLLLNRPAPTKGYDLLQRFSLTDGTVA